MNTSIDQLKGAITALSLLNEENKALEYCMDLVDSAIGHLDCEIYDEIQEKNHKHEVDRFKQRMIEFIKDKIEEAGKIDDGNHGSFHRLVAYNSVILWINAYQ